MTWEQFLEILKILFPAGISAIGTVILITFFIVFFPEKIEKWQSIIWGWIEKLGLLYKHASKAKIKHSIQGIVANFAQSIGTELPEFTPPILKLEFFDGPIDRKAFIDQGKAYIRLRRDDPHNENIVSGCMLYISDILLKKSNRYLSPTQKTSVQLYVGFKMLSTQEEEVYDVFIDRWLYPGIEKSNAKIGDYFERFKFIDEKKYFIPIFLQEIVYMGEKVFSKRRDNSIVKEFDDALKFLEIYANRRIGELIVDKSFSGQVCRFAIMIVGISTNVDKERFDIYLNHIQKTLIVCGVETIYLIGPSKYKYFIDKIAKRVKTEFNNPFSRDYDVTLLDKNDNAVPVKNYVSVLRKKQRERYIS